ncbi:MAG: 23S rRNA (uracil(1939)-C(5))-methyltransferase RlmD [Myxococcota bacterium]|nr:23S rRNA (uracil(1939)-C(5))-methyltransferase RlmD [Myxococcota bacterium]
MTSFKPRTGDCLEVRTGPWGTDGFSRTSLPGGWELRTSDAVPGEDIAVVITHVSRGGQVLWGRPQHRPAPSATRRVAPCEHHGCCGACGLQHVIDGAQFRLKVESAVAGLPPEFSAALVPPETWLPSPKAFGYRHKAVFLPALSQGRLALGGYARNSHEVVDLPRCEILAPALTAARRRLVAVLGPAIVDQGLPLRSVVARANRAGRVLVTLVLRRSCTQLRPLARKLTRGRGSIAGVHCQVHSEEGDAVTGSGPVQCLVGKSFLEERLGELKLRLGPLGFFQVNPGVLESLSARVLDELALHPRWQEAAPFRLLDLYCGAGVLGLVAARSRDGLLLSGIDAHEGSITAAQANAARNGIDGAEFRAGDVAEALADWSDADAMILDPPRAGMSPKVVDTVAASGPPRLVYVSCSAASLARDGLALISAGYRLERLSPADMMPQTPHLEWVASFGRS